MVNIFRNGIFISYSHKDRKWLDIIQTFLKPFTRNEKVSVWTDNDILPGEDWNRQIKSAIDGCRVAILLVTPNFLASDFIVKEELSLILNKSNNNDLIVFWIAVSHSAYKQTDLAKIQSANNPSNPLDQQTAADRNKTLVEIAEKITNAFDINAIGNTLKIIDEFVPQQKAFVDGKPFDDNRPRNYSIHASQQHGEIKLTNINNHVVETITADDLNRLDRDSKILIRSYENSMKELFERWTELQPKSFARDPVIREDTRREMTDVRKDLCQQLTSLLDFLHRLGKYLDDHYHHVRFICSKEI